jgi:hypothetical protein
MKMSRAAKQTATDVFNDTKSFITLLRTLNPHLAGFEGYRGKGNDHDTSTEVDGADAWVTDTSIIGAITFTSMTSMRELSSPASVHVDNKIHIQPSAAETIPKEKAGPTSYSAPSAITVPAATVNPSIGRGGRASEPHDTDNDIKVVPAASREEAGPISNSPPSASAVALTAAGIENGPTRLESRAEAEPLALSESQDDSLPLDDDNMDDLASIDSLSV